MTNKELAARILQDRRKSADKAAHRGKPKVVPYYMLNIQHPAVAAMYDRWRARQGPAGCPPSDMARTLFELDVLSPAGRALLEQHYQLLDQIHNTEGRNRG